MPEYCENKEDIHEGMLKHQSFRGNKPLGKPFYVKMNKPANPDDWRLMECYIGAIRCKCKECSEEE